MKKPKRIKRKKLIEWTNKAYKTHYQKLCMRRYFDENYDKMSDEKTIEHYKLLRKRYNIKQEEKKVKRKNN